LFDSAPQSLLTTALQRQSRYSAVTVRSSATRMALHRVHPPCACSGACSAWSGGGCSATINYTRLKCRGRSASCMSQCSGSCSGSCDQRSRWCLSASCPARVSQPRVPLVSQPRVVNSPMPTLPKDPPEIGGREVGPAGRRTQREQTRGWERGRDLDAGRRGRARRIGP